MAAANCKAEGEFHWREIKGSRVEILETGEGETLSLDSIDAQTDILRGSDVGGTRPKAHLLGRQQDAGQPRSDPCWPEKGKETD
jgi:hypothetical protein